MPSLAPLAQSAALCLGSPHSVVEVGPPFFGGEVLVHLCKGWGARCVRRFPRVSRGHSVGSLSAVGSA